MRVWQILLAIFFVESALFGIPTWIYTHDIVFASLEVAVVFALSTMFVIGCMALDDMYACP